MGDRRSPCGRCDYFLNHSRASLQKGRARIGSKTRVRTSPQSLTPADNEKPIGAQGVTRIGFSKHCPERGRKRTPPIRFQLHEAYFQNIAPKGDGNPAFDAAYHSDCFHLFSKHCPERGRKHGLNCFTSSICAAFSKHCPERGRKLTESGSKQQKRTNFQNIAPKGDGNANPPRFISRVAQLDFQNIAPKGDGNPRRCISNGL